MAEDRIFFCETIGHPLHDIKSTIAARGKFKSHTLLNLLLLLNFISPLSCKIWKRIIQTIQRQLVISGLVTKNKQNGDL